jgi:Secretion system C-terminal sorting domain
MKKWSLIIACAFLYHGATAQPVMSGNGKRIKLSDAVEAYRSSQEEAGGHQESEKSVKGTFDLNRLFKGEKEHDYRFNHWLWYWQRHIDQDGYLVSPAATWKAWKSEQDSRKGHSNARTTSSGLTWSFQGPDSSGAFTGDGAGSGVGRINVVAFHPTDTNTYIIGSPGGGAWRTTNDGHSWTCLTDMLPNLSVGDIKYNPLNANTIYLCSGDRDGSDYPGIGVLKSYDGGLTWTTTGMVWPDSLYNTANCILVNPLDTNSLILGTTNGVYRSYDGGASWSLHSAGNFIQMVYRPNDTMIVYAGTSSFGSSAQIYRSANGGNSWTSVTSFTDVDRVAVAVTPASPNLVKALASTQGGSNADGLEGIYTSTDSGLTFTVTYTGGCTGGHNMLGWNANASDCGGQGWYDLPIAISPVNASLVYIGGVNAWRSTNGGTSWTIMSQWTQESPGVKVIHADKHCMAFNPLSPNRFFETNDGGVYSAYNPTSSGTWRNLTNRMGITEFYGVGVSGVANFVIAGAQDVGTKLIRPTLFEEGDGGDGMWSQLDFADSTVGYASSEYGYIDIINPTAVQPDLTANDISANIAGGSIEGTGSWVTPFMVEPGCHTCLVAGYNAVYKSGDEGGSWTAISPSFSTSNTLSRVALTPADSATIFVAEDNVAAPLHYTHNNGTTWTTLTVPYSSVYVSDVLVDPRDQNHIWVTISGYGGNHVSEWSPTTGWQTFDAGVPDMPVHCITINKLTREMYLGTETGVYYRDSTMSSWIPNSAGMPAISVTDLEINYTVGEIWASTFGRSLWSAMLPTLVPTIAPFTNDGISIAPNPNKGSFSVTLNRVSDPQVSMRLMDVTGKLVWSGENMDNTGSNIQISTPGLQDGVYILDVMARGVLVGRQQLVVVR